jgi:hypothetical protein
MRSRRWPLGEGFELRMIDHGASIAGPFGMQMRLKRGVHRRGCAANAAELKCPDRFVRATVSITHMPNPSQRTPPAGKASLHVSLIALPDAMVSTLAGLYDAMNAPALMG